jgi:hypothetical protein
MATSLSAHSHRFRGWRFGQQRAVMSTMRPLLLALTQIVVLGATAILAERLLSLRKSRVRPIIFRGREPGSNFRQPRGAQIVGG